MQNVVRLGCGLALLFVLALAPTAWAQADQLQKAIELFDRQEYVAAQEALLQVEREQLDEAARVELDRLLQVVPEAIQGSKKAEQDQADASVAYEEGRWDEAEKLYRAVLNNKFAKVALRDEAAAQCQRIEEKRRLAEAAKPQGPVEGEPAAPDKPATDEAAETQEFQPPEDVDQADEPVEATDEPQEPPPPAEEQKPAAPPAPQRMTLVQEMRRADDLLWQRAVAKMQEISVKARDAVAAQRFDEARRFAEHAVQVIETARAYAEPASKYEAARAQATALKQEVADAYERHSIKRADQERKQVASRLRERADLLEKQRAEKIEQLFNTAGQLRQEQRFAEAADVLRQILYIDPANARARYELDWAEDYESFYVQKNYDRDRRRQTQQALTNAAEATVPWDYEVLYPKNWLELSARRAGAALGGQGRPDEDIELNRKLSDVLPDVRFEETPFETVVEFLADLQKVNISVDWEDLDMNGIERDKPVTVKLVELTFRTVL
ncbi:MAG: hypothetical protein KKB50_09815, partial [Planctomycetes bacterium]|nr:hypothetical protein [Planctomycetota bacterium]